MIDVAILACHGPDYLQNCLASVDRNIPSARVRIFAAEPEHPGMRACLDALGERVVRGEAPAGGVPAAMAAALADARHDLILMLRDDAQIVRPLGGDDLARIVTLFEGARAPAFVAPLFIEARRLWRLRRVLAPDPAARCYVSPPDRPRTARHCLSYLDVHIGHVTRLRAPGWRHEGATAALAEAARQRFGAMPMMADPFVAVCPEVPAAATRARPTLAVRLGRRGGGKGLKSFRDMGPEDVRWLKSRDLSDWPVAEAFLTPTDPKTVRPFVESDVHARLWLRALDAIERGVGGLTATGGHRPGASCALSRPGKVY